MRQNMSLGALLNERAAQENIVSALEITDTTITIKLTPQLHSHYLRPDCRYAVSVRYYDDDTFVVQGLGIHGKALRYQVTRIRASYLNDAGEFRTFGDR